MPFVENFPRTACPLYRLHYENHGSASEVSSMKYRKNPKHLDTWTICSNHSKMLTMWFYHTVMHPERQLERQMIRLLSDPGLPKNLTMAIRMTVVRIRILIGTTVVRIASAEKLRIITVHLIYKGSCPFYHCNSPFAINKEVNGRNNSQNFSHLIAVSWVAQCGNIV